jgi:FkbM family methyltransferase
LEMSGHNDSPAWGVYKPSWQAALCIAALRRRVARGALKKPLRKWLAHMSTQYDVEVDGLKLRCSVSDNYTEQMALERNGHTNRAAINLITSDLQQGDVFVDIGANCGLFTVFAARKVGGSGRVLAIEPLPQMLQRLKFNVAANGFTNVTVVESAVGAAAGSATIHVGKQQYGHSSLRPIDGYEAVQIAVAPLLAICQAAGVARIDALKIDIEGYEDRALLPFITTAPRSLWPTRILMEIDHVDRWETDCLQALTAAGYRIIGDRRGDALLILS